MKAHQITMQGSFATVLLTSLPDASSVDPGTEAFYDDTRYYSDGTDWIEYVSGDSPALLNCTVTEQLAIPTNQPTSLVAGSIWME